MTITLVKTIPIVARWDCSRDGHKTYNDGKWIVCSVCGYTRKA